MVGSSPACIVNLIPLLTTPPLRIILPHFPPAARLLPLLIQHLLCLFANYNQFLSGATQLVDFVVAAGLADTLAGEGPFTVVAPTNDAFAKVTFPFCYKEEIISENCKRESCCSLSLVQLVAIMDVVYFVAVLMRPSLMPRL